MESRKLGDVTWEDLGRVAGPDYAGIEVGIRFIGPGAARRWGLKQRRWKIEDDRRKAAQPDELFPFGKDEEGKEQYVTLDGLDALEELAKNVIADCCVGIRGPNIPADVADIAAVCSDLGVAEAVMAMATSMQSLGPIDIFTSDPSDVEQLRSPALGQPGSGELAATD